MRIRFTSHCRDNLSWQKNDLGETIKTLTSRPDATADVFLVRTDKDKLVWATSEDLESWNQLTLF